MQRHLNTDNKIFCIAITFDYKWSDILAPKFFQKWSVSEARMVYGMNIVARISLVHFHVQMREA